MSCEVCGAFCSECDNVNKDDFIQRTVVCTDFTSSHFSKRELVEVLDRYKDHYAFIKAGETMAKWHPIEVLISYRGIAGLALWYRDHWSLAYGNYVQTCDTLSTLLRTVSSLPLYRGGSADVYEDSKVWAVNSPSQSYDAIAVSGFAQYPNCTSDGKSIILLSGKAIDGVTLQKGVCDAYDKASKLTSEATEHRNAKRQAEREKLVSDIEAKASNPTELRKLLEGYEIRAKKLLLPAKGETNMKSKKHIRQAERNAAIALERFMSSLSEDDWREIEGIIKQTRIPPVVKAFEDSLKEVKSAVYSFKRARIMFNADTFLPAKGNPHETLYPPFVPVPRLHF